MTCTAASDALVTGLSADSRTTRPGDLFVAQRGATVDGHRFILAAAEAGAVAVVCEAAQSGITIPQWVVPDAYLASAMLADAFYGHPSHQLGVIGVTGTNGKTTVSHLIGQLLTAGGRLTGVIGTVGMRIGVTDVPWAVSTPTTPQPIELHSALAEMRRRGCSYAVMESSSHALELRRDSGIRYRAAVFTNLTRDHLDFHGSMDNYRAAKGKLFARLGNMYPVEVETRPYGVVNVDDPAGDYMLRQTVAECVTYGMNSDALVRATNLVYTGTGTRFTVETFVGTTVVDLPLAGVYNVYNALAALSVALMEGIPLDAASDALHQTTGVPGRLERVNLGQPFSVYVDYAHTPDSLENVLRTLQAAAEGRVICVVGCGGDRDKSKRPIMARIAVQYSDVAVLTSDNPRTEDPESILDDMEAGLVNESGQGGANQQDRCHRIADRRTAIQLAVDLARPGDVVVLAGKGHEMYQEINHVKHHFDDREEARLALKQRGYGQEGS